MSGSEAKLHTGSDGLQPQHTMGCQATGRHMAQRLIIFFNTDFSALCCLCNPRHQTVIRVRSANNKAPLFWYLIVEEQVNLPCTIETWLTLEEGVPFQRCIQMDLGFGTTEKRGSTCHPEISLSLQGPCSRSLWLRDHNHEAGRVDSVGSISTVPASLMFSNHPD